MNMEAEKEWPKVLVNDDGIRPAGKPGECFYCHAKIGELHDEECPTVCQLVEYDVRVAGESWDDLDGEIVGAFTRQDPWHWDVGLCEFHKNGSCWCAGNAVDDIRWLKTPKAQELKNLVEGLGDEDCPCRMLAFSVSRVIDGGPLRSKE